MVTKVNSMNSVNESVKTCKFNKIKIMKYFFTLLLMFGMYANAQILNDSTVQFVAYWNLNETHTYKVEQKQYTINGQDTTVTDWIIFDSEITILDSTANGYTVKWTYKNYDFKIGDKFTERLSRIAENTPVIYSTNEFGTFQQITNYEEIASMINKALDSLAVEFKEIPNIESGLQKVKQTFGTRTAIETVAINEIKYFHTPFGSQYDPKLRYSSESKVSTVWSDKLLDAKVESEILEVDTTYDYAMAKITTTIDPQQLTDVSYKYLKELSGSNHSTVPQRTDIPEMSMETRFASSVHMSTGWVLSAACEREVKTGKTITIESTTLELKDN